MSAPRTDADNARLEERLAVMRVPNAGFFATKLFFDSFAQPFPIPRDNCGLPIPTPPTAWRQYVALYHWPDDRVETVGFCNWIRFNDVYLEGGLCVRPGFYRRLPSTQFADCAGRGGIAQIMMDSASRELNDCHAWFGYVGDKKSNVVCARAGFVPTGRKYLIAKWFGNIPDAQKSRLIEMVAPIGPF
ncbi:MAG TPA: hypothetical protein VEN29_02570 [Casimicrobiaceae bacterium]|nr:hypothetical protein [Casimicrobiaceae bacterium]